MESVARCYPELPSPLKLPLGKAKLLLGEFDALRADDRQPLPEHYLRRRLNERGAGPVSEDEFKGVLEALESEGYLVEAPCPPPKIIKAPEIDGVDLSILDIRIHSATDAEPGDRCLTLVPAHFKTARACSQLGSSHGTWLLGPERIADQLLLCFEPLRAQRSDDVDSELWTFSREAVDSALAEALQQGLLVKKHADYQLTRSGELRRSELFAEFSGLSRPSMSGAFETPLRSECLALLVKLNEQELAQQVLVPLLRAMGFLEVTYNNGPLESGKDIVAFKNDELGIPQWLAIVAKAKDISGNTSGNDSSTAVANQIQEALDHGYTDPRIGAKVPMSRCWVVTSGRIKPNASEKFKDWLETKSGYRPFVRFIGQQQLLDLVAAWRPQTFHELAQGS